MATVGEGVDIGRAAHPRVAQENFRALADALLASGQVGGQVLYGGTESGEALELHSNKSKDGLIKLGDSSALNEANGHLGLGTLSPAERLHLVGDIVFDGSAPRNIHTAGTDGTNTYLRMYAGSGALSGVPQGGALQFFANASVLPGQVYIDSGAHASGAIFFRTAPAATAVATRLQIDSNVAANQTSIQIAEGSPQTLRRVQWKDGAAIAGGDKVMVLA